MKTIFLILIELLAILLGCIFAPLILVFALLMSLYLAIELIVYYFSAVHGAFNDTLEDIQSDAEAVTDEQ